jgi:hypothetical protein
VLNGYDFLPKPGALEKVEAALRTAMREVSTVTQIEFGELEREERNRSETSSRQNAKKGSHEFVWFFVHAANRNYKEHLQGAWSQQIGAQGAAFKRAIFNGAVGVSIFQGTYKTRCVVTFRGSWAPQKRILDVGFDLMGRPVLERPGAPSVLRVPAAQMKGERLDTDAGIGAWYAAQINQSPGIPGTCRLNVIKTLKSLKLTVAVYLVEEYTERPQPGLPHFDPFLLDAVRIAPLWTCGGPVLDARLAVITAAVQKLGMGYKNALDWTLRYRHLGAFNNVNSARTKNQMRAWAMAKRHIDDHNTPIDQQYRANPAYLAQSASDGMVDWAVYVPTTTLHAAYALSQGHVPSEVDSDVLDVMQEAQRGGEMVYVPSGRRQ